MTSSAWPPPGEQFAPPGLSYPPPPPPAFPPPQPGWQQDTWMPPHGLPPVSPFQPRRRKWPYLVIALVVLLIAGAIGAAANVYVKNSGPAKKVAVTYLSAMGRGDFDTAYDQWCAADQAVYPPAAFRAQHEYRKGEVDRIRGVSVSSGTTADIQWVSSGNSTTQSLALRRVNGSWRVCPQGDRLRYDMENCSCMSPSQHLDADVAMVLNDKRAKYPLNAVQCPALSALVDGQPVVCRGTSRDGRAWDIQATESRNATYTNVKIRPAATTPIVTTS